MKTTTMRINDELDKRLFMYAKQNDLSRNQVIKIALRKLFADEQPDKLKADRRKD